MVGEGETKVVEKVSLPSSAESSQAEATESPPTQVQYMLISPKPRA